MSYTFEYPLNAYGRHMEAKRITDIEQIHLTVVSSNKAANSLYASFGFVTYGIEKNALKVDGTYFDEELMVLFLK